MIKKLLTPNLIKKLFTRRLSNVNAASDINNLILHNDDDYLVINKPYGVSTFGRAEKKTKSIINQLEELKKEKGKDFKYNILYKLPNNISGCLLISKNKFIENHVYNNIFITLVYGKIEQNKNKNIPEEINMYLKYINNSNIMIPTNKCDNITGINKKLCYTVINNNIFYNQQNFSLLKIYINANDSKYIKPLLFYSLFTCIVGDHEYINMQKKIKKNDFFFYQRLNRIVNIKRIFRLNMALCTHKGDNKIAAQKNRNKEQSIHNKEQSIHNEKQSIYDEKQSIYDEKQSIYDKQTKLHLQCCSVYFESSCNVPIYISCEIAKYIKETLVLLGAVGLVKKLTVEEMHKRRYTNVSHHINNNMDADNQSSYKMTNEYLPINTNNRNSILNKNNYTYSYSSKYAYKNTAGNNSGAVHDKFYDGVEDEMKADKEHEQLLNDIYKTDDKKSKKKKKVNKKGVLAKNPKELSNYDAPIYFTNME
ncbi:pseudouridine synthase, putative [Hepatocystis sp. ex Piliocolobus tephrosceles]|nr:pseudouridine synthase, putative [Hepatocystis sp. ex Piliocolobus tephrosceles]